MAIQPYGAVQNYSNTFANFKPAPSFQQDVKQIYGPQKPAGGLSAWSGQSVPLNSPIYNQTATTNTTSGGSGGGVPVQQQSTAPSGPSPEEQARIDAENQVRNDINSGYNDYFASLDNILNSSLPTQRDAQLGIASSQGLQAENTLGAQKEQGLADLAGQRRQTEAGQVKSLANLADDVRNLFQAGQNYLGARGAADSSAANQYSYAISKMGNKGRADVLTQAADINNQINDREFKLKSTYDTELRNIKEQVNQKTLEIANWFSQAQQQIQQMKAQGQLSKGQDLASLSKQLLAQAQNAMATAQQQAAGQVSALQTWAANNSTTIGQLKANMAAIPGVAQQIQGQRLSGNIQGDSSGGFNFSPTGYGYSNEQKRF